MRPQKCAAQAPNSSLKVREGPAGGARSLVQCRRSQTAKAVTFPSDESARSKDGANVHSTRPCGTRHQTDFRFGRRKSHCHACGCRNSDRSACHYARLECDSTPSPFYRENDSRAIVRKAEPPRKGVLM